MDVDIDADADAGVNVDVVVDMDIDIDWSCQKKCSLKTPSYRNPVTKLLVTAFFRDK
ncbi:hypothetical protein D3C73_701740 [compost metagenome]